MTPSVSIYLTTHTLLKMRSIHISLDSSTCQRTMREERGTNATHQPFPHTFVVVVVVVCFSVLWPSPMVHVVAGVAGVAPVSWFVSWDVCVNVEQGRQWCGWFRGLEYLLPTNGRTSTIIPPSTSPRTQIQSHCSSNKPTPNVDSRGHVPVPHTMPVLFVVVVAHIVLCNGSRPVSRSIFECSLAIPTVRLLVVAPTSLHMLSVLRRVAPPLLNPPRTSLRRVNKRLSVDIKFGRTELVGPNHNS